MRIGYLCFLWFIFAKQHKKQEKEDDDQGLTQWKEIHWTLSSAAESPLDLDCGWHWQWNI